MKSAILFLVLTMSALCACGSTTTGGSEASCAVDSDCSTHCSFTGDWRAGAAGSTTNGGYCVAGSCYCCYALFEIDPDTGADSDGRCLGCNEVGTSCDADASYSCYTTDDVCLFAY